MELPIEYITPHACAWYCLVYLPISGIRQCIWYVSSVGSLDTLHATDGVTDTYYYLVYLPISGMSVHLVMHLVLDHWIHYTGYHTRYLHLYLLLEVLYAYGMHLVLDHWIHYTLQMVWWIPYQVPLDVCITWRTLLRYTSTGR